MSAEDASDPGLPPQRPQRQATGRTVEGDLDDLVGSLSPRGTILEGGSPAATVIDRVAAFRLLTQSELIPMFSELMEKYAPAGLLMEMDASDLLVGGREIRFHFGIGGHRGDLVGAVTQSAIAFHETRRNPHVRGEMMSAPMLRLRGLSVKVFREFICERLTILVREYLRWR